ncbi:MAG TPA: hypothetical protein DF909_03140, partial [Deltaproteobacteria bacterium]|nr:hypothetical protein [Deltaproteobacteria bacterium]
PEQDKIARFVFLPCISTQKKLGNIFVSKINPKVSIIPHSIILINAVIPVDLTFLENIKILRNRNYALNVKKYALLTENLLPVNILTSA